MTLIPNTLRHMNNLIKRTSNFYSRNTKIWVNMPSYSWKTSWAWVLLECKMAKECSSRSMARQSYPRYEQGKRQKSMCKILCCLTGLNWGQGRIQTGRSRSLASTGQVYFEINSTLVHRRKWLWGTKVGPKDKCIPIRLFPGSSSNQTSHLLPMLAISLIPRSKHRICLNCAAR